MTYKIFDLLLTEILYIYTYDILVLPYIYIYIYIYLVKIRNLKILLLTSYNGSKCYVCVLHIFFVSIDLLLTEILHLYIQYTTVWIAILKLRSQFRFELTSL